MYEETKKIVTSFMVMGWELNPQYLQGMPICHPQTYKCEIK